LVPATFSLEIREVVSSVRSMVSSEVGGVLVQSEATALVPRGAGGPA